MLAHNNADWYQLLDLCTLTGTLVADPDGIYGPRNFNDRMLLGLKGTMAESGLHLLRARLDSGKRNKAARGELALNLPVGLGRNEDGQVVLSPDEQVRHAIARAAQAPDPRRAAARPRQRPMRDRAGRRAARRGDTTIGRWLNAGLLPGEKTTRHAPWGICITDEVRGRFVSAVPDGYLPRSHFIPGQPRDYPIVSLRTGVSLLPGCPLRQLAAPVTDCPAH